MGTRTEPHCQAVLEVIPGLLRENSWWSSDKDLYTLLLKFRVSQAGDPRDEIYALLGICSDTAPIGSLRADHTKIIAEVESDAAKFLFKLPARSSLYTMSNLIPHPIDRRQHVHTAIRSAHPNFVDALLRSQRGASLHIGLEEFLAAAADTIWGGRMMAVLIGHHSGWLPFDGSVMLAVAQNKVN